ncbi:MAG: tyrosine-type recombinase/integrase [Lachnospiraceae bacterium]|nr:tyrosine-type recombinase/integrase [Lachnospiraceae bacterium]
MLETNAILLEKHKDILSFRDLAVGTVATYVSYMTSYIQWVEDNLPGRALSSVSWEEVRSYFRFLSNIRCLSNSTVNVHMAQLRDFYYYVLHKDWDKREVPALLVDEHLPIVPSKEQVLLIINSLTNPKHKAEIALLYSSGIRVSELCRLHCNDILRSKNCIYISRSKNRSDRYAVLSERAYGLLVDYILKAYMGAKKDDWLFPGQNDGCHVCTESIRRVLSGALEAVGLGDSGFNPRSLRHAFGLHLYESGADLMSIKEAMGHKCLSSTTIYLTLGIGNGRSVKSPYDIA